MVYHNQKRIKARGDREICDKIAGDLLERTRGDGFDGREGGYGGVHVDLVLLAKGTAFNVAADKGGKSGPPEFSGDQLSCFQEARMSGRLMIMTACKDCAVKGIVHRDINTAFIGEDASLDLPVSQPRSEGERNVFVHGLKGLEDEGVSCRSRFNTVREGGVDEVNEKGRREKGDISVIRVISGEEVGTAGQGIRAGKKLSGYMDHFEVEVSQVDKPMCLTLVKCLGLSEVG